MAQYVGHGEDRPDVSESLSCFPQFGDEVGLGKDEDGKKGDVNLSVAWAIKL